MLLKKINKSDRFDQQIVWEPFPYLQKRQTRRCPWVKIPTQNTHSSIATGQADDVTDLVTQRQSLFVNVKADYDEY